MIFYPHEGDLESSTHLEKLEVLLDAAERYKSAILEVTVKQNEESVDLKKRMVPREIKYVYNWDELAKILREVRDLPESTPATLSTKIERLTKLAEVYEVLRGAKMPKLEAVRLALVNEVNQLRSSSNSTA